MWKVSLNLQIDKITLLLVMAT